MKEKEHFLPESYHEAALRHSADADCLAARGQWDGAGYLIGFAVECAIKWAIISTRPAAGAPHIHMPKLIEGAKKSLQGRRKHAMFTLLEKAAFMQNWAIEVRYAANGAVSPEKFGQWRLDANRALAAANLRRNLP